MSHRAESERRLEEALTETDRRRFLPEELRRLAGEDRPLPIGHGQTNSQPTTVRNMLTLLDVRPGQRVLDLGAGSGWTTALLARLCGPGGRVIGVERRAELIGAARAALAGTADAGTAEAEIRLAQPGVLGAPQDAPYDRILVSAQADAVPESLVAQLADDGVMVIPVNERMLRLERHGEDVAASEHGAYLFVPLVEDPPTTR
ncbi:protein-L-isoaspartate O-methyltransferase [Brachybacterium sp. sponge]|uniref:protein-L-isoaspartate O-methyltransferase family protein n=1 Tax=Brachybacterium sp. sponge TaxID=1775432 RepID=UPI0007A4351F|nr:methyltransferase domain-containing protein [Brachybacterium sp. sponge]